MKSKLFAVLTVLALVAGLVGIFTPPVVPEARGGGEHFGPFNLEVRDDVLYLGQFGTDYYSFSNATFTGLNSATINAVGVAADAPAAGASGDMLDLTYTLAAMNGSDTVLVFDINLTNANHTSTSNVLRVFDIGNITGDADAVESALYVGSGWDFDINAVTSLEVGVDGNAVLTVYDAPAANASGDLINLTQTVQNMNGSDQLDAIDIALTSGTYSGSNIVNGLNIEGITGSANGTESAAYFGAGWDLDINAATSLEVGVDDVNVLTVSDPPAAGAAGDLLDSTFTLAAASADAVAFWDINPTNADHTGATTVRIFDIGNITGDAEATESALYVGSGYDFDINAVTSLEVGVDGVSVLVVKDPPAAGAGADLLDLTATLGIMDGSDTVRGLDIALTNADHTGASNVLNGIDIEGITADAHALESALNFGEGWDVDLNAATSLDLGIAGVTDFSLTANTFTIAAGSKIIPAGATGTVGVVFNASNTMAYTDLTAKTMFVIPANANVIDYYWQVVTASSGDGTDDTIACGNDSASDPDNWIVDSDADAVAAGIYRMGVSAAYTAAAIGDVGASDSTVYCDINPNTGDPSAGAWLLSVQYIID